MADLESTDLVYRQQRSTQTKDSLLEPISVLEVTGH